ncbi:MAG TPA: sialidase family protein [Verrucomicrobiae bacterium]|nr:sialidase family protein [Verrucomicrobiae bacterium]
MNLILPSAPVLLSVAVTFSLCPAFGAWAGAATDIVVERVLGPEVKTGEYKHPASFDELQDGDLYLAFFSGGGEYSDNSAAVFGTRLKKGENKWSPPVKIASNPFHALGNPVVWQAPDGVVWLFYVTRYGTHWTDSRIAAKISRDGAQTWSEPFMVAFEEGMMVRSRPIVLHNGEYLLPIYHEVGRDTEAVDAQCTSLFLRFDSLTKTWIPGSRVRSRLGNIQPAVAEITPNHVIAYCRRGGDYEGRSDGWMVRTESRDGGRTWSEGKDSEFPNPNAAVDFIKLQNGHLALVFNNSFTNRTPLTIAISTDAGKTFPHRRNIAEGEGDFAYPTVVQARDARIHVVYTSDERTVVRHAIFEESAVLKQK